MAEVKVPELAESITEGTIASWLKQKGDRVEKGENILELETDKVNVEVISEEAGVITELKAEEGDTVEVGQVIAIVEDNGEAGGSSEEKSEDTSKEEEGESKESEKSSDKEEKKEEAPKDDSKESDEEESSDDSERIVATPSARRMAREKGIDLSDINASDPRGLVRSQDVDNHGKQPEKSEAPKKEEQPQKQASGKPEKPVVREKMSRRRQTIAKRLLEVSQSTAMLTTFNEVDMTNLMELRKRKKDEFQERHDGTRLGFMSFFTKASVAALRKYPAVNAEIDGEDLVMKQFYDIGVAVSTDEGLVVPVVRDCDRKTFAEIESDIVDMAKKAQNKKLGLDDMTGGSFTITNGGVFGSLMSTPIINGTQAAILGMHTIQKRPVAIDDEKMENRPMMYIALSYDHRVIDGKEAVGFLKTIKDLIENPEDLLLEG
ncbi:2-oxoglutarate dehydrogenase complex dihydrolipoyllysine-residue succinyltransferase [Salinicoccus roseus]|jgi:2-oxoglutarate dehydrogenase E2 component (dihydrolipoamide succinyltransferase)|uniref:Dihydrolipoyllysine-residue succinyltransferase component of 2-oxoglutarate dehydrogenase complex n=1 Tax=Salinicoccus roseus TaxID=45670 RepID=A0A0C2DPK4_9STAP|nr:2-oxoglutarate dehydrogenase complex dihydrolipoyllysine-residue succinyltransferase [Salinicoccus roseus]KIH71993.1 dihydrolipoamide succinyltransferase [Salinicoccus roseus]MDB0579142.1 2-oxoglutarate dehydrogenase complex dihydrolipoyllysine-residue succinyltransferase [Salinicoccus roseus]OZT77989.1 dihydrolipoyllysine-residue succinyltransferase [Salinicoccus roseus]RPE54049.1 2-oxoglutarate dehydrogenase E2 component [Salinicoccus roseus]GGA68719.1 dihydrolipoyllysine-residue succinyl